MKVKSGGKFLSVLLTEKCSVLHKEVRQKIQSIKQQEADDVTLHTRQPIT